MPHLNLNLHSNQELQKDKVVEAGLKFDKDFSNKWTKAQLKVLDNVLSNIANAGTNNSILYYERNQKNEPTRYNPMNLGHKVMVGEEGVLSKLTKAKLITRAVGDNPFFSGFEDGQVAHKSEFRWYDGKAVEFAKLLGITSKTVERHKGTHHIILKVAEGQKQIDYKDTTLTQHMENVMQEYNNFLNEYSIKDIHSGVMQNIHLRRTFRDYDGSGQLKFGGRSGGHWHEWAKIRRKNMTINGKAVAREPLDFPSSIMNLLYAYKNKTKLEQIDRYTLEGFDGETYRKLIKQLTVMMFNTRNSKHCARAFTYWLGGTSEHLHKRQQEETAFFPIYKMQKLIREKHKELGNVFYQPNIGHNLAFLESSHIHEVALQCCRQGVPAITVFDEIIVIEEDRDIAKMIMNSTHIDKSLYKSVF